MTLVISVSFRMEVEDLIDSEIMQIVSIDFAKEMVTNLMGIVSHRQMNDIKKHATSTTPTGVAPSQHVNLSRAQSMPASAPRNQQHVAVQPVQFTALSPIAAIYGH